MATSKRERQKAARREKLEQRQRYDKRRKNIRRGVIVAVIAIVIFGSGALLFSGKSKPPTTTTTAAPTTTTTAVAHLSALQTAANAKAVAAGCPASTSTRVNTMTFKTAPPMTINKAKTYDANFTTTAGNFVVKLDPTTAPITVNNFVFLAEHKFYNCVIFHRVIPGFMIQGGDPTGTGSGGPGYTIPDEYPKVGNPTYPLYSIAMANETAPHTGGSQFFIVTGASGETLGNTYSLFGQVISGFNVVKTIQNEGSAAGIPPAVTNRMLSVTITEN
ncbi:MAG TPA: peptidylprolyl isomerase [Acidimicrobiales bacterium]|nr:peptidylprolyl isomerase [Acidimicrobiales bacterium]